MTARRRTISEFHYHRFEISVEAFTTESALHDELAFKLGLPRGYGRATVDLAIALASIGDPGGCLCRHWDYVPGKKLVIVVRVSAASMSSPKTVTRLTTAIATANAQLAAMGASERVWMKWVADLASDDGSGGLRERASRRAD